MSGFWFYPWSDAPVLLAALGLVQAGAAVQFFLLRRAKRFRRFPLLCVGVTAVLEILYQVNQFGVIRTVRGYDIWNYVGFGVIVLYILFGTLIGWALHTRCWRGGRKGLCDGTSYAGFPPCIPRNMRSGERRAGRSSSLAFSTLKSSENALRRRGEDPVKQMTKSAKKILFGSFSYKKKNKVRRSVWLKMKS